jgi:hypothetical protein
MSTKDITDTQVIAAYLTYAENRAEWPQDILRVQTGKTWQLCLGACARAASRGFIDYGVSLRSGWVTRAGRDLLGG